MFFCWCCYLFVGVFVFALFGGAPSLRKLLFFAVDQVRRFRGWSVFGGKLQHLLVVDMDQKKLGISGISWDFWGFLRISTGFGLFFL